MFPAKHKLNLRTDAGFFSRARRIHTPYFTIFFTQNEDEVFRATVVVSKKVAPKATMRNKIKRRIFGLLQKNISEWEKIPASAVFLIKSAALLADEVELLAVIQKNAGIIGGSRK
jgi:ribonuclease P protein component